MILRLLLAASWSALLASAPARAGEPRLAEAEVIRIADKAARKRHYELRRYQPPKARYELTRKDDAWTVFYEGRPDRNGTLARGHHFSVRVDDKTRNARVFGGR